MVSPFMAAADDGMILRTWFQWLPIQVDLLLLPASDIGMLVMAMAMAVLSLQYLLIFFLVMPLRPLLRCFCRLLIRPLRHGLFAH